MSNVFPEKSISDVTEVITSPVDKKTMPDEIPVYLCNYTDVYYNSKITGNIPFMAATAKQSEIDRFSLFPNDVVITKDSESADDIGIPTYVQSVRTNLLCGYHLTILRPKKNVDGRFLSLALTHPRRSYDFYRYANGITRFGLTSETYSKVKIPLPSLPEQKAIASLLSTWDEAIEKTEQLIQAKEKQFKWLLQELISEPQNTQKNTEWKKVKLGDVGTPYSGLTGKNKEHFGRGEPYLPYLNVYQNFCVTPTQLDYVQIIEGENQKRIRKGDAFFTVSSETPDEVGISSVLLKDLGECYLNSFCFGWRPNSKELMPEYLQFYFRSSVFRKQMMRLAQGATRFNLSKTELMKSFILFPSLEEQKAIAEALTTSQYEIELLKQLADKYKTQKHGLMQKMLTGEWRVKPEIVNQYMEAQSCQGT